MKPTYARPRKGPRTHLRFVLGTLLMKLAPGVATCRRHSCLIDFQPLDMNRVVRKPVFAYANTKTQISFAVLTAKLTSAFVFATRIVESLYFLNPKFQASSHLLWLYSLVCVGPGRKPRRPIFSQRGSYNKHNEYVYGYIIDIFKI